MKALQNPARRSLMTLILVLTGLMSAGTSLRKRQAAIR